MSPMKQILVSRNPGNACWTHQASALGANLVRSRSEIHGMCFDGDPEGIVTTCTRGEGHNGEWLW